MKVKYLLKDISVFFTSKCCNREQPKKCMANPCGSHARVLPAIEKIHRYLETLSVRGCDMNKTTITIGNKIIGMKSYKEQYDDICRIIKLERPYRGAIKYIYHFELQKNGQLHAHGLEIGSYMQNYVEAFSCIGARNAHPKSFVAVKRGDSITEYLRYMNKENILPMITNITKKEMIHAVNVLQGKGDQPV